MKDKRIWLVILGILVIGILVTGYTRSVVKKQADSAAFEGEISTEASLGPFKEQTEEEAQKEESGAVQEQAQADTAVPETEQKGRRGGRTRCNL